MVKVLIYSSKEIFDKASYDGRAEADIVAYGFEEGYIVTKDRTNKIGLRRLYGKGSLANYIRWAEDDELKAELKKYNAEVAQR